MEPDRKSQGPDPAVRPLGRREFLASGSRTLGGGWIALQLPAVMAVAACARESAATGEPLGTFTEEEGRAFAALAETILPSGEFPGAGEAGVLHFADAALGSFFQEMLEPIREGLAMLDRRAVAVESASGGYAGLEAPRQESLVREIETSEFFFLARMITVIGMFSDPSYGGNRNGAGHRLLAMEHAAAFQPPFGHYDREDPPR